MVYGEKVGNSHKGTFFRKICRNFAEKFSDILVQNLPNFAAKFRTRPTKFGHEDHIRTYKQKIIFDQKITHHKLNFIQFNQYIEVPKLLHMWIETVDRLLWLHKGLQALEVEGLAEACNTFHTVIMTSAAVRGSNYGRPGYKLFNNREIGCLNRLNSFCVFFSCSKGLFLGTATLRVSCDMTDWQWIFMYFKLFFIEL